MPFCLVCYEAAFILETKPNKHIGKRAAKTFAVYFVGSLFSLFIGISCLKISIMMMSKPAGNKKTLMSNNDSSTGKTLIYITGIILIPAGTTISLETNVLCKPKILLCFNLWSVSHLR